MPQDVSKPRDTGRIKLPRTDTAMTKIAPSALVDAEAKDEKTVMLRPGRTKKSAEEEQDFLAKVRKRFSRCLRNDSDNANLGRDDDKFYGGDQWPASVTQARAADNRPMLTINKLPTLIHQVTNDYRQNPPSIDVHPVGDGSDTDAAKIYRGIIRAIERDSGASDALGPYNTAFESAARKGFGYWRIVTEYESPKSFDQVIVIKRIRNAFTVHLDPDCQEATGCDARFGFISTEIPRSQFEADWPWADPMSWEQAGKGEEFKAWVKQDVIRIAEYYEIEEEERELVMLSNGHVGWEDELHDSNKKLITGRRTSKCPKVTWYKLTAHQILEEADWPGQWVPIVRCVGEELDIDGQVKYWGIVRMAKDAQRMFNYWRTAETELVALAPKAPWIAAEGQLEGHEQEWKTANTRAHVVLQYVPTALRDKPVPPPQRQQFAGVPQGVVGAAGNAAQDMLATTGVRFDSTGSEHTYDESGKALRERRRLGDMGNFHLTDNNAASLRFTGDILIDLIPKIICRPERIFTILRLDDQEERVQINPHQEGAVTEIRDKMTGKIMKAFNPTVGRYGVTTIIGPSYATKRIEAAESMMDFARALPNVASLIPDLIAKNQDWPGAEEMATRLAKSLPPNLLTPEQKDVPPQVQALLQSQAGQIQQLTQQLQALMQQLMSTEKDRAQKQDKIDKDFEVRLLGILQKAQSAEQSHIGSQIKDLAQAVHMLHDHLANPEQGTNA